MLKTDSVFEALREVKRLAADLPDHGEIYFVHNDYYEIILVTDESNELEDEIYSLWSGDNDPESEASEYKGVIYEPVEWARRHPKLYRNAGVWNKQQLIRRKITVEPEHSVTFNVSAYVTSGQ